MHDEGGNTACLARRDRARLVGTAPRRGVACGRRSARLIATRGLSSVGRALPLQGRCQEFESPRLHAEAQALGQSIDELAVCQPMWVVTPIWWLLDHPVQNPPHRVGKYPHGEVSVLNRIR